ncbi:MAG TPA: response regulator transcription factor [Anaerolineaceae bacterium]|nr:response regulator transcription factor [Anaerolineaceae bacterium]
MNKVRVLIVDDHPVFRFGLRSLISSIPEMEVIAEATSGEAAIEEAKQLEPDIILMDINMPGINGIEATRRILAANPEIGILILTMFENDSVFEAIQAGARGYILKGADPGETLRAIQAVINGEAIFSSKVADRLIDFISDKKENGSSVILPELTDREREVLDWMARGLTNTAISEKLFLSPKTVRNHVSNVFAKLQVSDRTQAVIKAREAGLGR